MTGFGGAYTDSVVRLPEVVVRLEKESDAQIAKDLGVSRERVRQVRSRLGIRAFKVVSVFKPRDVLVMLRDGVHQAEIRRRTRWSHAKVMLLAKRHGLVRRMRTAGKAAQSANRAMSGWTERREAIREAWNAGAPSRVIAEAFGYRSVASLGVRVAGWRRRGFDFVRRRDENGRKIKEVSK